MLMSLIYLRNVSQNLSETIFLDFFADDDPGRSAGFLQNPQCVRAHTMQLGESLTRDSLQILELHNSRRGKSPAGGSGQFG